ncbi:MAG: polyphosphate polymerase domain-containing protein [Roseburia sp.]|nr:polyphosphate polymerase domain-containing protein [Roseburia sp.]
MAYQAVFKRYEIKYLLTAAQAEKLKILMRDYMTGDKYGNSTVCNLYLDTPDFLLVRRSIEKPAYKEKLRLRSYGVADKNAEIFCELKKKYEDVVYKRRLTLGQGKTESGIDKCLPDTQIGREISYCFKRYENLAPKVFLSYEREAFYAKNDGNFRMTFDKNILWRDCDLTLSEGVYGSRILAEGYALLEVKTAGAMPLWLVKFLSGNKIYKTSFSKYGTAYMLMLKNTQQGEEKVA